MLLLKYSTTLWPLLGNDSICHDRGPCKQFVWFLSRTPNISIDDYQMLLTAADQHGYNATVLDITLSVQNCSYW
jgi:hypothetical protein